MTKKEMDKLRGSVLYKDEKLKVIYTGNASNFPKNVEIETHSRFAKRSVLLYPNPKWIACNYYIYDLDGDLYKVATDRFGKLEAGFEWIK